MHDDPLILSLFMAHRRDLVNYASAIVGNRAHAEDMVQEAYLRFHEAAGARLLDEPIRYLYRICATSPSTAGSGSCAKARSWWRASKG